VSAHSTCFSPLVPPGCERAGLVRELSVAEAMVAAVSRGESRFRGFQFQSRHRGQLVRHQYPPDPWSWILRRRDIRDHHLRELMNCVGKGMTSEVEKIVEGSAIQLTQVVVCSYLHPASHDQRAEMLGSKKMIRKLHVPEISRVQGTIGGASEV
jgi:hypothetical protein